MPITVSCTCGKAFRVKDELAGKTVRCPNCKSPLRIGASKPSGKSSAGAGAAGIDEQAALLKFQEAQRRKQLTAEEEAAARAEQKKIIESYDQLSGKGKIGKDGKDGKEAKKPERITEALPKKPTIFTKIADLFGAVFGTFLAKYIVIAVFFSGGVVGSVFLVKYVASYVEDESSAGMTNSERADLYMKEAAEDIAAGRWKEAKYKLDEVVRLNKALGLKRDYRAMVEQVNKELAKSDKK